MPAPLINSLQQIAKANGASIEFNHRCHYAKIVRLPSRAAAVAILNALQKLNVEPEWATDHIIHVFEK